MPAMIFRNYGGNYQLRIETPKDLENILELDEARWAATSAPIEGLNCDPAFLAFLDTDSNGRIRTDEVRAGIRFLLRHLANRGQLSQHIDILRLDDIDTSHPEGKCLRDAAELILTNLGAPESDTLSLFQVRNQKEILSSAANNGDGVIPPYAGDDAETTEFIQAVMDCVGSVIDAGGEQGVSKALLETFIEQAKAHLEWEAKGQLPEDAETTAILPWGRDTANAWSRIAELDEKIEQFFAQCDMVRFDERSAEKMRLREEELKELDFSDRALLETRVCNAPLAPPNPQGLLRFDSGDPISPPLEKPLRDLRDNVLQRAVDRPVREIDREQWNAVKEIFAPYKNWLDAEQGAAVGKLGRKKLTAFLEGPFENNLANAIAADHSVAEELREMQNIEKLILYQQWMMDFANSFVSFPNLYDPDRRCLFEMGTLIIDGRELTFAVRAGDRATHKKFAQNSNMHILYVEVAGKNDVEEKFEVVAAVTAGDSEQLLVEKRGVFITLDGREWDARVVDIIENPVSLWEAFKAPFGKVAGFFTKQVEKFGKTQEAKIEGAVAKPAATGATRDLLLAGSIGVAALGSSFAYITKAMFQVAPLHVLIVVVGLTAVLLGPNLLIGYFKLRRRDLTALLEASGWAINFRMRLTNSLGRLFTRQPPLPEHAQRQRKDLVESFLRRLGAKRIHWTRVAFATLICVIALLLWMLVPLLKDLETIDATKTTGAEQVTTVQSPTPSVPPSPERPNPDSP